MIILTGIQFMVEFSNNFSRRVKSNNMSQKIIKTKISLNEYSLCLIISIFVFYGNGYNNIFAQTNQSNIEKSYPWDNILMNKDVTLFFSRIIAGVFTIIGSVVTHLFTMRKFYKESLEKHYEKLYDARREGYVLLWRKLRFFAKHNNFPDFNFENLGTSFYNLKEFYEWLTFWYYDLGYGIHMSRQVQGIYVKLLDEIKWYLNERKEYDIKLKEYEKDESKNKIALEVLKEKYSKVNFEKQRNYFVDISSKLRTQITHDLGARLKSKYKLT